MQIRTKNQQKMKSNITKILKNKGINTTGSARGGYHIRFRLDGGIKDYNKLLNVYGYTITETSASSSGQYTTYDIAGYVEGEYTNIDWVNNTPNIESNNLFVSKDLTPNKLMLGGCEFKTSQELIDCTTKNLNLQYSYNIVRQLVDMMNIVGTSDIKINHFSNADLKTISKDFGEILAAIWCFKTMNISAVKFPSNSNEKLLDFSVLKMKIYYPISVKSGNGSKVAITNIITMLKEQKKDLTLEEISELIKIIDIADSFSAKDQMIELHKHLNTDCINDLSTIIGIRVDDITVSSIEDYVQLQTPNELSLNLGSWWNNYSKPKEVTINGVDKKAVILSPLGETMTKSLNSSKIIVKSLTNLSRNISLMQIDVNVLSNVSSIKSRLFKTSTFGLGWPGYTSGNKIGFKLTN